MTTTLDLEILKKQSNAILVCMYKTYGIEKGEGDIPSHPSRSEASFLLI